MNSHEESTSSLRFREFADERRAKSFRRMGNIAIVSAIVATAVRHGLLEATNQESGSLGAVIVLLAIVFSITVFLRYRSSLRKQSFLINSWSRYGFSVLWFVGTIAIVIFAPTLPKLDSAFPPRVVYLIRWSELLFVILGVIQIVSFSRSLSSRGVNPAILLVASFAALISVGTLLLLLPRARAGLPGESAPFLTAFFTATSASCVTGLIVEPTGTYWSRFGQTVIMLLFQIGGLGIMTFGALFVAMAGRSLQVREQATLRKLLDSDRISDVRRMLLTILVFTFSTEFIGLLMLSGLWADQPLGERLFQSCFHSISAFCNAGFSLTEDSFVGMEGRWEIWFGTTSLIITGGLGFGVVYNVYNLLRSRYRETNSKVKRTPGVFKKRVRLSLTSRIVLSATAALLLIGTLGFYLLESFGHDTRNPESVTWANSWFQSVTFRTAGFNTLDLAELEPTTKLFAIAMMFIGASPGSTGGGVKTVSVVLMFLSVVSLLRGKNRVELSHRRIPDVQVQRAFLMVTFSMVVVMVTTFLLVLFEQHPEALIDHLFEATSAVGTVGLSTGVTGGLSDPSRVVIILAMFAGRVGPLTLLLALAGEERPLTYDLPEERVVLG